MNALASAAAKEIGRAALVLAALFVAFSAAAAAVLFWWWPLFTLIGR